MLVGVATCESEEIVPEDDDSVEVEATGVAPIEASSESRLRQAGWNDVTCSVFMSALK